MATFACIPLKTCDVGHLAVLCHSVLSDWEEIQVLLSDCSDTVHQNLLVSNPWAEEPGGLQSMRSQGVRHD